VNGVDVYVDDACGSAAQEYDFPTGGSAEKMISLPGGVPAGVAVTPPLVP
jgi:hypothetical protein